MPTDVCVTILLFFCKKYLHILRRFLRRFLRGFLRRFLRQFCAGFCAGFCASPSARSHRSRMAIASQSHRRRIAAMRPHRIAKASRRWRLAELHLPVVHPTRCTQTEDVEPQQWALCEAMMRTHVAVMVERLWPDDSAKVMSGEPSDDEYRVDSESSQHNPHKKLKQSNHEMQYCAQYLSSKLE
jgi:hypothetical protein